MKLTKHAWLIWGIVLIIVLALALLIPFVRTTVYWLGLGCTVAMFLLCAYTFRRAFCRNKALESKLLGWPIFKVGYAATSAQIILGFLLMALAAPCPIWVAILAEIILFGCVGVSLTVKDAARKAVIHFETTIPDQTGAWKSIRTRANAIAAESNNPQLRKLAEEIRFADPNPSSLDAEIAAQLDCIAENADAAHIQRAFSLLQQRKALVKAEKQA